MTSCQENKHKQVRHRTVICKHGIQDAFARCKSCYFNSQIVFFKVPSSNLLTYYTGHYRKFVHYYYYNNDDDDDSNDDIDDDEDDDAHEIRPG